MIFRQPRTLVIDDKQKDGEKITSALNSNGYPARFILFDTDSWGNEQFSGVRAVFLDLALLGSGVPTDQDRSATVSFLLKILQPTNGPWALVTWTTYANDADTLYNYLRERLPKGMRPLSKAILDKEKWLPEIEQQPTSDFAQAVIEKLELSPPVKFLLDWETAVQNAAASVLHQLTEAAEALQGNVGLDEKINCLLIELAKAEAGKTLGKLPSLTPPLYTVLTPLLTDCLDQSSTDDYPPAASGCSDPANSEWQYRINRMLHLDTGTSDRLLPGSLLELKPSNRGIAQLDNLGTTQDHREKCLIALLSKDDGNQPNDETIQAAKASRLYLLDITPPCDHAQARAAGNDKYWRRFVVVYRIPKSHDKIAKKIKADSLYSVPAMSENSDDEFILIANANLMLSIIGADVEKLPKPTYRIREQLFHHILSWLGRHISRQGIVSLGHG